MTEMKASDQQADIIKVSNATDLEHRKAEHLLNYCDNDTGQAISQYWQNNNNSEWPGHLKNKNKNTVNHTDVEQDKKTTATCKQQKNVASLAAASSAAPAATAAPPPVTRTTSKLAKPLETFDDDDRAFYKRFKYHVDTFIKAVSSKWSLYNLKELITNADREYQQHTHSTKKSNLVNRTCFKHKQVDGRTPLAYAVVYNYQMVVHDLISLGAQTSKVMQSIDFTSSGEKKEQAKLDPLDPSQPTTALVIAATNNKRDGTELLRVLLSKGANVQELESVQIKEKDLNRTMRYWISKSRRIKKPSAEMLEQLQKQAPADKFHELDYAVIGEEICIATMKQKLNGRILNPKGIKKPLVMLMTGPPGHGKTYFSRNTARSVVGEDNFLFIPCGSIKDDADLFGSNIGGMNGKLANVGKLTSFLRTRQNQTTIVFLDEFDKIRDLTSALGHPQHLKIYQSFLEPWAEGHITDWGRREDGSEAGKKIDCSKTIWILTANWGQKEIINFASTNSKRVYKSITTDDATWLQNELVTKVLKNLIQDQFRRMDEGLLAVARRIDSIIPFLPFTKKEQVIVADTALREIESLYREPKIETGPEENRRLVGNLHLQHTKAFCDYVASKYDPSEGASVIEGIVSDANGLFLTKFVQDELGVSSTQLKRIFNTSRITSDDEPSFWIHFDKVTEQVTVTQTMPIEEADPDELFENTVAEETKSNEKDATEGQQNAESAVVGNENQPVFEEDFLNDGEDAF